MRLLAAALVVLLVLFPGEGPLAATAPQAPNPAVSTLQNAQKAKLAPSPPATLVNRAHATTSTPTPTPTPSARLLIGQGADRGVDHDTTINLWMAALTGGLLLVAGVQAYLFLVQLRLMREAMRVSQEGARAATETAEAMKQTTQRGLRAYVAVSHSTIHFPRPGIPVVKVVVRNTGQTPASNVRQWIHMWVERYPLTVELGEPPEGFVMGQGHLGGNGGTSEMVIERPNPIAPCMHDRIGTADCTIYIYGRVEYDDIFGHRHFLKYRLMYGGAEEGLEGSLKSCPEGNEGN